MIVNAFLKKLAHFRFPNLTIPDSYRELSAFLLTIVDTLLQIVFNHDIYLTTNVDQTLNKLSTPVRVECNKNVLKRGLFQPFLKELSEWLLDYAKSWRDLPTSSASAHLSSNLSETSHSFWKQSNQQNHLNQLSNRSQQDQRANSPNSFQQFF